MNSPEHLTPRFETISNVPAPSVYPVADPVKVSVEFSTCPLTGKVSEHPAQARLEIVAIKILCMAASQKLT